MIGQMLSFLMVCVAIGSGCYHIGKAVGFDNGLKYHEEQMKIQRRNCEERIKFHNPTYKNKPELLAAEWLRKDFRDNERGRDKMLTGFLGQLISGIDEGKGKKVYLAGGMGA